MSMYYVTARDRHPLQYSRGYTLKNALAFARIGTTRRKDGSQSSDRIVTRGKNGPIIRVYSDGERVWPVYVEHVDALKGKNRLTAEEIPSKLIFKIGGKDVLRPVYR